MENLINLNDAIHSVKEGFYKSCSDFLDEVVSIAQKFNQPKEINVYRPTPQHLEIGFLGNNPPNYPSLKLEITDSGLIRLALNSSRIKEFWGGPVSVVTTAKKMLEHQELLITFFKTGTHDDASKCKYAMNKDG